MHGLQSLNKTLISPIKVCEYLVMAISRVLEAILKYINLRVFGGIFVVILCAFRRPFPWMQFHAFWRPF